MARVLGIGGIFIKSRDPAALAKWYGDVLGIAIEEWGGAKLPIANRDASLDAFQVWSPFAEDTSYFAPSSREIMINFEVDDLDAILARVTGKGVAILGRDDSDGDASGNGRFAWVLDPDGTKIELWQPAQKK